MPVGIITDTLSVAIGGILGALVGNKLQDDFKEKLQMIFGVCSMGMGISTVILMENMPAVILSIIIGTALGLAIHLGDKINIAGCFMQKIVGKFTTSKHTSLSEADFNVQLVTIIVLFCASGTGIYGSIIEGISGDPSIMISKAILDFFTAMIFACTLGMTVSLIAIPQFIIFMLLFILANIIYPLTTTSMINDFKACGGIIMIATGFRMIRVKMFPIADMIPAMILVMPISWMWTTYITPLLG